MTDSNNLECVNGKYFKDGKYVPLAERTPTNNVEKALTGYSAIEDCITIGFSYWHIHVTDSNIVDTVHSELSTIFDNTTVSHKETVSNNVRYEKADSVLVFKVN